MVFEINLLPEKYRKKKLAIKLDARVLGIAGAIVLFGFLGMTTVKQGKTLSDLELRHTELSAQKIIVEQAANTVRRQKDEVRNINTKITTLQGLGGRNAIQLQVLEMVSNRLPDDVYLLDINQIINRQAAQGGLSVTAEQVLNFTGVALL